MFQQSLKEGLFRLKHGMSLNIASQSRTLEDLATLPIMYYSHSCQVQQASHCPVSSLYYSHTR